jgi:hypothetical protein
MMTIFAPFFLVFIGLVLGFVSGYVLARKDNLNDPIDYPDIWRGQ